MSDFNITQIPANANNFMVGRNGKKITSLCLHWIVGTLEASDATFQNPARLASAHYAIGDADIHQYVKEENTAYHAGNFTVNLESIGIEHEGGPTLPITDLTYATSAKLIADIAKRYNIALDREHIKGHREVSLKPTQCPGTLDIDRLINLAKAINMPEPEYSKRQAIIDTYRGLTGENANDDEITWRLESGKNIVEIIEDICSGDSRFYNRWIKPQIQVDPDVRIHLEQALALLPQ